MNTLGWQSLEVLRAMLDWEDLNIRRSHAMVQALFHLHRSNIPLFVRWDSEFRSCIAKVEQMRRKQDEVFTTRILDNSEFAELEKKRPEISTEKEQLEIELLKLAQREEECVRGRCAVDKWRDSQVQHSLRTSIELACEAHEVQRVRCVELMEAFRRDYLDDPGGAAG
jgi:hypothetical protein